MKTFPLCLIALSLAAQVPQPSPQQGGGGGGGGAPSGTAGGCLAGTYPNPGLSPCLYVAGGGIAQAQTATYSPAITLTAGQWACWLPTAANTAAAPTFAPNGLTAHTIVGPGGSALSANDIITTAIACAVYDTTGTQWELQNPQSNIYVTNAEFSNGTCTTAKTIAPVNGNRQKVTLTNAQACALTFTQPAVGTISIQLKIIQSAAGSFNGTITGGLWPGGTTPTITATSGAIDIITCYLDGTNAYCIASQDFR